MAVEDHGFDHPGLVAEGGIELDDGVAAIGGMPVGGAQVDQPQLPEDDFSVSLAQRVLA